MLKSDDQRTITATCDICGVQTEYVLMSVVFGMVAVCSDACGEVLSRTNAIDGSDDVVCSHCSWRGPKLGIIAHLEHCTPRPTLNSKTSEILEDLRECYEDAMREQLTISIEANLTRILGNKSTINLEDVIAATKEAWAEAEKSLPGTITISGTVTI